MTQPTPEAAPHAVLAARREEVARFMRVGSLVWLPLAFLDWAMGTQNLATTLARCAIVAAFVLLSYSVVRLSERALDLLLAAVIAGASATMAFSAQAEPLAQAPVLAGLVGFPLLCFAVLGNRAVPLVAATLSAGAATLWLAARQGGLPGAVRWGTLSLGLSVYVAYGFARLRRSAGLERVQVELEYRALIEALAEGTLVRAQTEVEVVESAGLLLRRAKLDAAFLKVDGEVMRLLSANYVANRVTRPILAMVKGRLDQITLRIDALPWLQHLFQTRRGAFRPDIRAQLKAALPPSIYSTVFTWLPMHGGVDVPLFSGDQPFGVMTVRGARLSLATVAALELFAHQLEIALENVELHERRRRQLEVMTELKQELLEQQRLAGLGEAAAVMAHEVRNPLGVISNAVSLLNKQKPEREESRAVLLMLDEEVSRLDRLVSELLQVARPKEHKVEPLDVGALLERCAATTRKAPACAGVNIEVEPLAGPETVRADVTQLEIAIGNLLMNAVQASAPGATVRASCDAQAEALCLRVDDTGPGVPPESRDKVFAPFFTTRAKGTGLGLTIVRQIARAQGGDVHVEDAPGGGARFVLRLKR